MRRQDLAVNAQIKRKTKRAYRLDRYVLFLFQNLLVLLFFALCSLFLCFSALKLLSIF